MNQKLYIILPVHNRKDITTSFVKMVVNQTYKNFHLILVDDGSTDGTVDAVKLHLNDITVITGDGNLWWGGALHKGYLWVKDQLKGSSDAVLIINDDVIIESDFLEKGLKILQKYPFKNLVVAENFKQESKDILIDSGVYINWNKLDFNLKVEIGKANSSSTRGLFLNVADFIQIGGFYPIALPHYLSDYEFTHRAYKKGYKIITNPSLKLFTAENTTGYHSIRKSSFKDYAKNLFSIKYAGNPIYFTTFILISCPFYLIPLNLLKVWYGALKNIINNFKR
ncbi:glycosyltransferase family 2 protein [Flavobacterium sp.]|uniref:glycosyltransferase family 2 protein n=1 Tax=Flavobacterium sp. TaxID=239 RepID=UPI003BBD1B81